MKKLFLSLIVVLFAFSAIGQERFEAETTDGCTITYEVTSGNTVKVYAFERDYEGPVTIPSIVTNDDNEYTVTAIGAYAGQGGGSMEDGGPTHEEWYDYHNYITSVFIPYTVETIEPFAFQGCNGLSEIIQITFEENSNLTTIVDYAFTGCMYLTEITIPSSVSYWGPFEGTGFQHIYFEEPSSLTEFPDNMFYGIPLQSIEIPEGVTSLGSNCFNDCYELTSVTLPSTLGYIGTNAFVQQEPPFILENLLSITCLAENPPTLGDKVFGPWIYYEVELRDEEGNTIVNEEGVPITYNPYEDSVNTFNGVLKVPAQSLAAYREAWGEYFPNIEPLADYVSDTDGSFNNNETWGEESDIDFEGKTIYIKKDHTVTLNSELVLNENTTLINDGVLKIAQGGELIIATDNNAKASVTQNDLGIVEVSTDVLPNDKWSFIGAPFAGYKLEAILPGTHDISISMFNYGNCTWEDDFATINTEVGAGEGFFAWSWAEEATVFTTYGDVWDYESNQIGEYNPNQEPAYSINSTDVDVTKTFVSNNGNWMALVNPYTFKLDIGQFIADQNNSIQGGVFYKLNDDNVWQTATTGAINLTEGFFVNFVNAGSQTAHFKTTQRYTSSAKASVEREFVRLAMLEGEREIELLFAHNEEANENYDIFDANKLFSPVEIAEPYFVTNNIALVKEEVNTLPYYATMNVRSFGNKEVKFKANYIPEGLSVSIIDGEETIDLAEGVEYTTNIVAGENAERFKVLIKKSLSLEEAEELQVNIFNNNRHINIETLESDIQVEVYNALGQKVFTTRDHNFALNNVPAGAYLIKAFNANASKTAKVIVK